MKTPAIVLAILCAAVAAVGAAISSAGLMALGLLGAVAAMVWFGMSSAKKRRLDDIYERLGHEERTLIRPIKKLYDDLQTTAKTSTDPTTKVIAEEAVVEARTILEHCIKLVELRSDAKKGLYGRSQATADLEELKNKLERAEEQAEKDAFAAAIQAREKEAAHYASMEASLEKIDATLRQAEASLAEIKARLAVAATSPEAREAHNTELEETLTRLRSLSVSFDEAEDLLRGRTG